MRSETRPARPPTSCPPSLHLAGPRGSPPRPPGLASASVRSIVRTRTPDTRPRRSLARLYGAPRDPPTSGQPESPSRGRSSEATPHPRGALGGGPPPSGPPRGVAAPALPAPLRASVRCQPGTVPSRHDAPSLGAAGGERPPPSPRPSPPGDPLRLLPVRIHVSMTTSRSPRTRVRQRWTAPALNPWTSEGANRPPLPRPPSRSAPWPSLHERGSSSHFHLTLRHLLSVWGRADLAHPLLCFS